MVKTSLVEAFDDRDVIRQISKLTDEVRADTEIITEKAAQSDAAATRAETAADNADKASTRAEVAAATALGLGGRVKAVEDSTAQNHSDITVLDGEVTDINNDLTNVVRKVTDINNDLVNVVRKVTSDVQKVNKGLRVGEVPTGDDVVVSRKVLQDFVDSYASMVRTTGDQRIMRKTFLTQVDLEGAWPRHVVRVTNFDTYDPGYLVDAFRLYIRDKNGVDIGGLRLNTHEDGSTTLQVMVRNASGSMKYQDLIRGDSS